MMGLFVSLLGSIAVAVAMIMAHAPDRWLFPATLAAFVVFAWMTHGMEQTE